MMADPLVGWLLAGEDERPRQDSNLRTRLRRPHPGTTLTCINARFAQVRRALLGRENTGGAGCGSGCGEVFHRLACDLGDDVEVLVEVQDGEVS